MQIHINWADAFGQASKEIEIDDAIRQEADLWKPVGKALNQLTLDHETDISVSNGSKTTTLAVQMYNDKPVIKLISDNFHLPKSKYEKKSLRRVDAETNKKSFYDIIPNNMGPLTLDVGAHYGLLGTNAVEEGNVLHKPFPSQLYWWKYYQKLNEGYTDVTDYLDTDDEKKLTVLFGRDDVPKADEESASVELYSQLIESARGYLDQQFRIDWLSSKPPYTKKQVDSCWKIMESAVKALNKAKKKPKTDPKQLSSEINRVIVDLLKIASPKFKKGTTVKSFLINDSGDLATVISDASVALTDWENRIQAMDAVAAVPVAAKTKRLSPFGGVEVHKATAEEFKHMQDLIALHNPNEVHLLKEVYMLDCKKRTEAYEKALNAAENKTEKELFHGSITSNMVSLISAGGPTIHVSVANGRAYGNGSYWSSDFDKSLGYTSYSNSRWSHGQNAIAWMLVGRVHYGKPYFPKKGIYDAEQDVKDGGYDCCHAMPYASGFRKDEIITYDEKHSCVEAILKFGEEE